MCPVKKYVKPTEALYGIVRVEKRVDEPKHLAREHMRKRLLRDLQ